jgi:hypothetical protein
VLTISPRARCVSQLKSKRKNEHFEGQRCALRCWLQCLEYGAEKNGYDLDRVPFSSWLKYFEQNDTPEDALKSVFLTGG